jgi:hypothetical protein
VELQRDSFTNYDLKFPSKETLTCTEQVLHLKQVTIVESKNRKRETSVIGLYYNILWHVDPLLGNDRKNNYITARKPQQSSGVFCEDRVEMLEAGQLVSSVS